MKTTHTTAETVAKIALFTQNLKLESNYLKSTWYKAPTEAMADRASTQMTAYGKLVESLEAAQAGDHSTSLRSVVLALYNDLRTVRSREAGFIKTFSTPFAKQHYTYRVAAMQELIFKMHLELGFKL